MYAREHSLRVGWRNFSSCLLLSQFLVLAGNSIWFYIIMYQSKTIKGPKNVSYDAQLRPIILKSPNAPSAQATHQTANRHYEEVKSSCPDSQTLKNLF